MKSYSLLIVIAVLLGCREEKKPDNGQNTINTLNKEYLEQNDFHPLIDLILDRVHPNDLKRYNIEVNLDSTVIPRLTNFPPPLEKGLVDSIKIELLKRFKNKISPFELDTSKLNTKNRKTLKRETDRKSSLRIIFNSFLKAKNDNLVVTAILFNYPAASGWEEIVIFEKQNGEWTISDRIGTVDY